MDSCARPRRTMDTHRSDVRSRRRSHSGHLLWQRPLGEPRATDRLGRLRAALCRRATLASRGLDSNFQFPAEIGFGFSRLRRLSAGVKVFAFHRNHPFCARAPAGRMLHAAARIAELGAGTLSVVQPNSVPPKIVSSGSTSRWRVLVSSRGSKQHPPVCGIGGPHR